MNFKQFFTESKDISNMCEIEDITHEDMYGDDIVKSWKLTRHFNTWQEVTYFISLDKDGHYHMMKKVMTYYLIGLKKNYILTLLRSLI